MAGQIEIEIYDDFPADYQEKLSTKARAELKTLLAQLQVNPYEPSLQKNAFFTKMRFLNTLFPAGIRFSGKCIILASP